MAKPPTAAEVDVLRLVARGMTTGQIALALGVTANTVKTRMASVSARVGAHSREEAVARVFEAGLEVVGTSVADPEPGGPWVSVELAEQLLAMCRMVVTDQPLGALRKVAQRALLADLRQSEIAAAGAAEGVRI